MGKIKYQLIPPEESAPSEEAVTRGPLKVLVAFAMVVLTVLYYNWPNGATHKLPKTFANESRLDAMERTSTTYFETQFLNTTLIVPNVSNKYFVNTSKCQMPALDPFTSDVLQIFHKTTYKKCNSSKELITVNYDNKEQRYSLHLNEADITCCYKPILRTGVRTQADNQYKLLPCSNFHQDFVVPQHVDAVLTECRRLKDKKLLQRDAFGFVQQTQKAVKKSINDSDLSESIERRPSVLLWGIDSMSRMNFQRTMPLMYKYLREENWHELQGYNKMGDNTYPNLMALLTGYNSSRSRTVCRPNEVGGLDACPMLWKDFKAKDYVTAYAEDWSAYATFNHLLRGFRTPPTDYYARPLMLAIVNELTTVSNTGIPYCVGRRHYAEYVYDAALQFTEVHRNQSSFGMFWTNSFSHNNFALPSSMDAKMLEYMRKLNKIGTFENSIILFFSDHGMRFGPLRSLDSGFLEERLPIMYIWLPNWFKQKYPAFAYSLQLNRNRLTSPYDIYATLKHVLELQTLLTDLPRPEGCPSCHSLFYEVAESRDCREAGIDEHWCTCQDFEMVSPSESNASLMAEQLVEATNSYLAAKNLTTICQKLKLTRIESVKRESKQESIESISYLVRYATGPAKARFEASVKWHNATKRISVIVPEISRLTEYDQVSKCMKDAAVKKFCICAN